MSREAAVPAFPSFLTRFSHAKKREKGQEKVSEKAKKTKFFAVAKNQPDPFVLTLKDEIKRTQLEMETAYSNFSCSTVPELIDSSIYEVKSIWNRYQYLLRQLKSCQLKGKG